MGGLTVWHSVAASAPGEAFKNRTISRAKRSAGMPDCVKSWQLALAYRD
jgi:hypothetical protein